MHKLYKVEAKVVSYFWADEEHEDVEKIASDALAAETGEDLRGEPEIELIYPVWRYTAVEEHWRDGIPYGSAEDNRSVSEIFDSGELMTYDPEEDYSESEDAIELTSIEDEETNSDLWKEEN